MATFGPSPQGLSKTTLTKLESGDDMGVTSATNISGERGEGVQIGIDTQLDELKAAKNKRIHLQL